MNTAVIIEALEAERDRLTMAMAALKASRSPKGRRKRRHLTAAARHRISQGMKKKWAERKKKG